METQSRSAAEYTTISFAHAPFAFALAAIMAFALVFAAVAGPGRAFADETRQGSGLYDITSGRVAVPELTVVGGACELVSIRAQEAVDPDGAIASVFHDGAMTYYDSLASAIEAAVAGDTVTLMRSTVADVVVDKSITLNLGGKTLIGTGTAGTVSGFPDIAAPVGVTADNAVICNGTVRSRSTTVECVGIVVPGASASLSRLAIESTGSGLLAESGAQLVVDNVAVSGSSPTGVVVADSSSLVLSSATVVNSSPGMMCSGWTATWV